MVRPALCLCIALAAPAIAGEAAGVSDGNDLLRVCTGALQFLEKPTPLNRYDIAACLSYVDGTLDGFTFALALERRPNVVYCIPPQVPRLQQMRVIVRHLQDRPAILHEPAVTHVLTALGAAFPCK